MLDRLPRPLLLTVTALFAVLSAAALWQHGYWGILAPHFRSTNAGQVFADLLVMVWLWYDAKEIGRNGALWLLITLIAGSFGPLLYLLTRPRSSSPSR
jgi:hypothetical protein